jgi:hypothetical protein
VTSEPSAVATVLDVLQRADGPLSASAIKQTLEAGGLGKGGADHVWSRAQRRVRAHEHVEVDSAHRYRWVEQAAAPSPAEALERLADGGLTAKRRAELVEVVRAALNPDQRAMIPYIKALAELAIEVEELAFNEASARAVIHRVRAQMRRLSLEPIDAAGEKSTLDRMRHEPIGRPIGDGTAVVVVRPGYVWKTPSGDVLVARAVVQDRTG